MMKDPFDGYDWSCLRLLRVLHVSSHGKGPNVRTWGKTDYYQLCLKFSGKTDIVYGGKYLPYHAGSVLYLPRERREDVTYLKTFTEPGEAVCIFFDSAEPLPEEAFLLPADEMGVNREHFLRVLNAFSREDRQHLRAAAAFYSLLARMESGIHARRRADAAEKLNEAESYIRARFTDPYIPVEELAGRCGTTPDYFRHLFCSAFGMPPLQYINRLKLEKAQQLLENTAMPVSDVALAVGYADPNYFARLFRRHLGISPTDYRKKWSDLK